MKSTLRNLSLLHQSPQLQRSRSDTGTVSSQVAPKKLQQNYILITQEILNGFRKEEARSSKVTLKFNSIKYREPSDCSSKPKLPCVLSKCGRITRGHAATSLDLSRTKPVKVFVKDITQCCRDGHSTEYTSHLSSQNSKWDARHVRSLDSGEECDPGEDAIDSVARANSIPAEHPTYVLPEIRAAPCPIHIKRDKGKGQDILYSTTSHVRDVKMFKRFQPHPIKSISIQQNVSSQDTLRGNKMGINIKVPGQYPIKQPTLPKNMPPKDYVMSWLIHGSAPQGSNHFPEIVQPGNSNSKAKVGRKRDMSE